MEYKDWIAIAAQILVFAGLVFAVIKFAKDKKREFQKRFFEEQLTVFNEAVDNASMISLYDKEDKAYDTAQKNFNRLFWGKMCIVEDRQVEAKMVAFKRILDQYDTENNPSVLARLKDDLRKAALVLAHTCRNTSLQTWEIKDRLEGYNDYTLQHERETIGEHAT